MPPVKIVDFSPVKVEVFKAWLRERGAEVMIGTNPYELVRFCTSNGVSILYSSLKGKLSFTGESREAYHAYRNGTAWTAKCSQKEPLGSVTSRTLRERDGDDCFFCLQPVAPGEGSVEHLVPRSAGGPNHLSNLFLAHKTCNSSAGHLDARAKIALHVQAHLNKEN